MRSRKNDLRAPGVMKYIHDERPDSIPPSIGFLGDLFPIRKDAFCLTQIGNNITPVETLDNSVYNFTLSVDKTGVDRIPFRIFHFLYDDLFGRLCGNTTKGGGVHF